MKYISKTQIAISVNVNGKNVHIAFTAQTGGGSVYYTNDEAIAKALERHHKFGKLFKKVAEPVVVIAKPVVEEAKKEEPKPKERKMSFACYDDAKDYLVNTYGISRTKLRTQTAIQNTAKAHNIILTIE